MLPMIAERSGDPLAFAERTVRGVRNRDSVHAFLEYASQPAVDKAIVQGLQSFSPIAESNEAIEDPVAREFLPMFVDAITPMDWLWEPKIDRRDRQSGPGSREGRHRSRIRRTRGPGRGPGAAFVGPQLLPLTKTS